MQAIHDVEERTVTKRGVHASEAAIRAVARGAGSAATRRHLDVCDRCADLAMTLAELADTAASDTHNCPDADAVARAVSDQGLADLVTARHIVACTACAGEVMAMQRLDDTMGPPPTRAGLLSKPAWLTRLRALAQFEMPVHLALQVRRAGPPAPAPAIEFRESALYDDAMRAYRDGRYEVALRDLGRVVPSPGHGPAIDFFRGACLVALDRTGDAVAAFARAVRGRPRLGEYRWYLAQAQLLDGRGADAQKTLAVVARIESPFREMARDLQRRIGELGLPQATTKDRVPTRARRHRENG